MTGNLPDSIALARGLARVLVGHDQSESVLIERRTVNPYASSTASEFVTCRLQSRGRLELFCKYGPRGPSDNRGHRGGLGYEAWFHERVLGSSTAGPPYFHGAFALPTSELGLAFEALSGAVRVTKLDPTEGIRRAAEWIGRFHARHAVDAKGVLSLPLRRYDLGYYLAWAERTRDFADRQGRAPRWLVGLCDEFPRFAQHLVDRSNTVVHGEYYPHNVLVGNGAIHPVDWETAAVGAGEIDVAALTEGWPRETAEQCEDAYGRARWGNAPKSFGSTMLAARLYLHFRWLGDRPEWSGAARSRPRWTELRTIARRLALEPTTGP